MTEEINGAVPQWVHVSEDGKPAVLLNVYEQPDGNAVQIAAAVRQRLAQMALPPGVKLSNWYDQSQLVQQSAASVRDAVLIGLLLAGLVLVAFLRSWRVMLIALLVVPGTLAITVPPQPATIAGVELTLRPQSEQVSAVRTSRDGPSAHK